MKLLVVDDRALFREALATMLGSQPGITVVGVASNASEAVEKNRALRPNVILMDYVLRDGSSLDATRAIVTETPDAKVVFLSDHDDVDVFLTAIRSGAKGFLLKDLQTAQLVSALRSLENNEPAIMRHMVMHLLDELVRLAPHHDNGQISLADFTGREVEILRELASEATNKEIAARLSISVATVKNHIHKILVKLDVKQRHEAARFARLHGLGKKL